MNTRKAEANKTVLAEQFLAAIDLSDAEMDAINGAGGGDGDDRFDDFRRDDRRDTDTNINLVNLNNISCLGGGWW